MRDLLPFAAAAQFPPRLRRPPGGWAENDHSRRARRNWPDGRIADLPDRRVELDSYNVENPMPPIVLSRKNALFDGHDEGGRAGRCIASLIET